MSIKENFESCKDFEELEEALYKFEKKGFVFLYHCSRNDKIKEIKQSFTGGTGNDFGGLFFSYHPVFDYGEFVYITWYKRGDFNFASNREIQNLEEWKNIEDEDLKEAVGDDSFLPEKLDKMWEAQIIRINLAKKAGFNAVEAGDGIVFFSGSPLFFCSF